MYDGLFSWIWSSNYNVGKVDKLILFYYQEEKICIDESGMTQFDPLHHWEDHKAVWKMQVES